MQRSLTRSRDTPNFCQSSSAFPVNLRCISTHAPRWTMPSDAPNRLPKTGTHPTVGSGAGRRVTVQRGLGPVGPSWDSVGVSSLLGPGLRRCSKSSAVRVGSVAPISVGFKAAVKLGRHVASSGAVSISFDLGRDAICPPVGVRLWFGVGEGGMSEAPARRRASGADSGLVGPAR
jgi:hypothetical protein